MSTESEKIHDLNDTLDFWIEKTHAALFEADKITGNALLTYLLMLCLTALLVLSEGVEDRVSVPLLQLTFNKIYAAALILTLSCGAFFWFLSTRLHSHLLGFKLDELLEKRCGRVENSWSLSYPSIYNTSMTVFASSRSMVIDIIFIVLFAILLFSGFVLPLYFAWKISGALGFSFWQKSLACIGALILLSPSLSTSILLFRGTSFHKETIKRFEEYHSPSYNRSG
jgi:hypothetical protein